MRTETTFRIEMLKFCEDLFPDSTGLRDGSGWKCLYAKSYKDEIRKNDIKWFLNETLSKITSEKIKKDDVEKISDILYNRYKHTIDSLGVAIIIKSKTVIIREEKSFIAKFFSSLFGSIRRRYNKTLESMKI